MAVVRTRVHTVSRNIRVKVPTRTGYVVKSIPSRVRIKVTTRTPR